MKKLRNLIVFDEERAIAISLFDFLQYRYVFQSFGYVLVEEKTLHTSRMIAHIVEIASLLQKNVLIVSGIGFHEFPSLGPVVWFRCPTKDCSQGVALQSFSQEELQREEMFDFLRDTVVLLEQRIS